MTTTLGQYLASIRTDRRMTLRESSKKPPTSAYPTPTLSKSRTTESRSLHPTSCTI